jgi:hypothetical protein
MIDDIAWRLDGTLPEAQTVAEVQAQTDRLQTVKAEWAGKLEQAGAELATLQETAGADVLAAVLRGEDSTAGTIDRLTRARATVDIARQTLRAIEAKELELTAQMTLARAAEMHTQAQAKRAELDAHNVKRQALLDNLQTLDGGVYVPQAPPRVENGVMYVVEGYTEHTHRRLSRELANLEQSAALLNLNAQDNMRQARKMAAAGVASVAASD